MANITYHEIPHFTDRIHAGYGNTVQYTVTHASDKDFVVDGNYNGLNMTIRKEIMYRLANGRPQDEFSTSAYTPSGSILYIRLRYHAIPDYLVFQRIFRWWYNFAGEEALTPEDFRAAYGKVQGDHIYEKWIGFHRDLTKMVGYLGDDYGKGQLFFGMVMEKVLLFENRTISAV